MSLTTPVVSTKSPFVNYYFSSFDSPIGNIEICATDTHLVSLVFKDKTQIIEENSAIIIRCKEELSEYFSGKRKIFSIPVQQDGTPFQNKIWNELPQIPFGKTVSYLDLALKAGNPLSVRAIGNCNSKNKLLIILPCHRVIGKKGELVGYAGELWRKKWLLDHEARICGAGEQLTFG